MSSTSPQPTNPFIQFTELVRSSLGDRVRPEAEDFFDMLSEEAVWESPYAPQEQKHQGKTAIQQYVGSIGNVLHIDNFTQPLVYEAKDAVVIEYSCSGSSVINGRPYHQNYITSIQTKNGYITYLRDYWNPLLFMEAMDAKAK